MSFDQQHKPLNSQRIEGLKNLEAPISIPPSDKWSQFSDSILSSRHLGEEDREARGSSVVLTIANISKLYVGIAFLSASKSIS